jgi:uncharacterized protein YdcH (DUF465 family)
MGSAPVDAIQSRLIESNEEYRQLAEQHSGYAQRLDELASKPYPTPDEQFEESRLKKLKLHLKDQMQKMLLTYQQQAS